MAGSSTVWNNANTTKTLNRLRKDYPGYTNSELYAIWCVQNDAVPLDGKKVDNDAWKDQADQHGKSVEGGFKTSRVLLGRARKAKKGQPKPARKARSSVGKVARSGGSEPSGLSATALKFAQRYDEAGQAIEAIQQKKAEIQELLSTLKDTSSAIADDLAQNDAYARKILKEAGAL